jgi:NAD+ synthase
MTGMDTKLELPGASGELPELLAMDIAREAQRIEAFLRDAVLKQLRRRGAVVAVSGGIDSAVCATLAARALGPERVLGLLLPEKDSAARSARLGRLVCDGLGITTIEEHIAPALDALGCYRHRDEAIRLVFPEYQADWKSKIAVAGNVDNDLINYFTLTVQEPGGARHAKRMPLSAYLGVVAATNMKQRVRKLIESHHAERLNYAVIGTPNKLEYDLGFFVRGGDGLADVKPIAGLYKSQVYAMAHHIGVPAEVRAQMPSTDTYSLPQSQEEFYYALPYEKMDVMLKAYHAGMSAEVAGATIGLTAAQAQKAYRDIAAKLRVAAQLHRQALVPSDVTR